MADLAVTKYKLFLLLTDDEIKQNYSKLADGCFAALGRIEKEEARSSRK